MHTYNLGDSDSDDEGIEEIGKNVKEESDDSEVLTNITKHSTWNAKDIEKVIFATNILSLLIIINLIVKRTDQ